MSHKFNPDRLPDSQFVLGTLEHLVVRNRGRLLDPRRTPIRITSLIPATGHFEVEIEDFEDKGAHWEVPFEKVGQYQFEKDCSIASPASVSEYKEISKRLDQPLEIPCRQEDTIATQERVKSLVDQCGRWLKRNSEFLNSSDNLNTHSTSGHPSLFSDLQSYMHVNGLLDMENAFAERFVSNPYSGEMIKGHRIVLAELGMVPFKDTVIRDPALFNEDWSRERREEHITHRLAFLRTLLGQIGIQSLTLYRGLSFEGQPEAPRTESFVSTSTLFDIAHSCFAPQETSQDGLLIRQIVSVDRFFMTYLETEQMNRQFLEAEVVLLCEPGNPLF